MQDALVRDQVRDSVAPFSPLWRRRFGELNRKAGSVQSVADLATIPAMGERDISPNGDPAGMASMVLQAGEAGYALHAPGPQLRRALRVRATGGADYQQIIDADTRATSYVFAGSGFTYPIASTRSDLDVITRAGARLWSVLGLTGNDVLISAVEPAQTTEHVALQYAAIGAGAPALFPGGTAADLAAAIRLAPPTVLALPSATAVELIEGLTELTALRTVLMVGAPTDAERIALSHALHRVGAGEVTILTVHAPAGARVLWGECRASGGATGLHTYPDLEVVQVVDPDTGESTQGAGELVLTQLGMRGSALLRWRTADVVAAISAGACPSCRRVVPRLEGLQRSALVTGVGSGQSVDLRTVASALSGRTDVRDWRIVVGRRRRDGASQVVVHLVDGGENNAAAVIGAATDIRAVAGALPTQIVLGNDHDIAALYGTALSARMLIAS
jgi:phenylacetate-coenzyme A ligase PaaK-like adenylate-forming protein